MKRIALTLTTLLLTPLVNITAAEAARAPYNVLFIAIDDLNDWVGVFGGAPQAQSATPRMDKFAQSGSVVFQQANCAGPVCCPSRSALLSGFMPNRSGIYGNSQNMLNSELVQTHYTLPEYCSKHGYRTLSTGKVFHKHVGDEGQWAFDEWVPTEGGNGSQVDPQYLTSRNRNLIDGKPAPSVRDERWYFIRYNDGMEEFYDMERDPMQWTNLASSKDPEIRDQKSRLAASFPASFEHGQAKDKVSKEDKSSRPPDSAIKAKRAATQLK
jgi:arylsulfatase A-like enzyme